jgi:hypothetical protein
MAKDEFGFDPKVINVLQKKDTFINETEQKFFNSLSAVEQEIFKAVWAQAQKMNQDSGNVLFDEENIDTVNKIQKTIQTALQSSSYPKDVKTYLRSFEDIKRFNLQANESVNDLDPAEVESLVNPVQKAVVNQTLEGLTGSGVDTNFIQPVKEGIFKNVVAGSTMADLEKTLRQLIISGAVDSKLKRYVTQVSRDALNQFDGQVNSAIANEFGLDAYRYVGSLIDDSRPQCIRWAGKQVLLKEDLAKEISWATSNGTGMIAGTTPDNFATFRGGYNCRHSAIPFKLTASQKAKLQQEAPAKEAQIEVEQAQAKAAKEQEKVKQQEAKVEQAKAQVQEAKVVAKEEEKKAAIYQGIQRTSNADKGITFTKEDEDNYLRLGGVPEDAKGEVGFQVDKSNKQEGNIRRVYMSFKGSGVRMQRTFYVEEGRVHNDYFRIEDQSKYKGQGAKIFSNQVAALTEAKYKSIDTQAARGSMFNGYYTWARLGYVPESASVRQTAINGFNKKYGTDVLNWGELLGTKKGQEYWKEFGTSFEGIFYLKEGGYSQTTLKNYLESKGKPQQTAKEIEAIRKAEEKARKQAEAEAKRKAKEEERKRKEEEKKRKAEEKARKKAEAEAKKKAKEEERKRKEEEKAAAKLAKEQEKAIKKAFAEKAKQEKLAAKEEARARKAAEKARGKNAAEEKPKVEEWATEITLTKGNQTTSFDSFVYSSERYNKLRRELEDTHSQLYFSREEKDSLLAYKGSGYTRINQYLREGKDYSPFTGASKEEIAVTHNKAQKEIDQIRNVLNRHDLPLNSVLFRGHTQRISFNPFEEENLKIFEDGFILTDKGFRSTSFDPEVAPAFVSGKKLEVTKNKDGKELYTVPIINKILAKKGTKGYFIENVSAMGEAEFLLPDNLNLKVLKATVKINSNGNKYLEVISEII